MFRYPAIFPLKEKYTKPQRGSPLNKQISEGWNEPCDARKQGVSSEDQSCTPYPSFTPVTVSTSIYHLSMGLGYVLSLCSRELVPVLMKHPWGWRREYQGSRLSPEGVEMLQAFQIWGSYICPFCGHIFCFVIFYAYGINILKKIHF